MFVRLCPTRDRQMDRLYVHQRLMYAFDYIETRNKCKYCYFGCKPSGSMAHWDHASNRWTETRNILHIQSPYCQSVSPVFNGIVGYFTYSFSYYVPTVHIAVSTIWPTKIIYDDEPHCWHHRYSQNWLSIHFSLVHLFGQLSRWPFFGLVHLPIYTYMHACMSRPFALFEGTPIQWSKTTNDWVNGR